MRDYQGTLLGRVALSFDRSAAELPSDLSACARTRDGALLLAADERARIELLRGGPSGHRFEQHRSFELATALGRTAGEEVDIEGLSVDVEAEALFLIGSHSAKRKKPKGKDDEQDLERLATVRSDPARVCLARVQLTPEGEPMLAERGRRGVALLPDEFESSLLGLLSDDPHLAPFLARVDDAAALPPIPGKDNGFDIEGLAYRDGKLLIGLRGPVLRGWAFVLELTLEMTSDGTLSVLGDGKRRYRKHALELDGLGIRELMVHGDDVLVLAGPTMALDGAHRLYRWVGGPRGKKDSLVAQEPGCLEPLFELPTQPGGDRAEGLAGYSWFAPDDSVLVVYDAPSRARRLAKDTVLADVFALAPPSSK